MKLFSGKLEVELGGMEMFHGIPWSFGSGQNSMELHKTTKQWNMKTDKRDKIVKH